MEDDSTPHFRVFPDLNIDCDLCQTQYSLAHDCILPATQVSSSWLSVGPPLSIPRPVLMRHFLDSISLEYYHQLTCVSGLPLLTPEEGRRGHPCGPEPPPLPLPPRRGHTLRPRVRGPGVQTGRGGGDPVRSLPQGGDLGVWLTPGPTASQEGGCPQSVDQRFPQDQG